MGGIFNKLIEYLDNHIIKWENHFLFAQNKHFFVFENPSTYHPEKCFVRSHINPHIRTKTHKDNARASYIVVDFSNLYNSKADKYTSRFKNKKKLHILK